MFDLPQAWRDVLAWLAAHDALVLFLMVFAEESGVPMPVPSDVAVLVAGHRVRLGHMSLPAVFLIGETATLLGASVLYWAGRRAGRPLLYRYGELLRLSPRRLAQVERVVTRWGAAAVIFGRLVPGLRVVTPLACGVFRVPYGQFLPALALGSSLYLAVFLALGYIGGPAVLDVLQLGVFPLRFLVTSVLLAVAILVMYRLSRQAVRVATPAHRQAAAGRRSLEAALIAGLGASAVMGTAVSWLLAGLALLGATSPEEALLQVLGGGTLTFLGASGPVRVPLSVLGGLVATVPLLVASQLAWALVYAFLAEPRLRGPAAVRGLQFAVLPWLFSGLVLFPLLGFGLFGFGLFGLGLFGLGLFGLGLFGLGLGAGFLPMIGEGVRYAVFGASLGTLYRLVRILRQPGARRGWRHGHRHQLGAPPSPDGAAGASRTYALEPLGAAPPDPQH
jgi:membrane protein DedA with SNARE-associated domain